MPYYLVIPFNEKISVKKFKWTWRKVIAWTLPKITWKCITRFFIGNAFFLNQSQCCITFSWTELQMLLTRCLIHTSIMILRYFLYLLYLCPCLGLGLFMSYLCDLFFVFIFIFTMINRVISWVKTRLLFFLLSLEHVLLFLDDNMNEECE